MAKLTLQELLKNANLEYLNLDRAAADPAGGILSARFLSDLWPMEEGEVLSQALKARFPGCRIQIQICCPSLLGEFLSEPGKYAEALAGRLVEHAPGAASFLRGALWESDAGRLVLTMQSEAGASYMKERGLDTYLEGILRELFRVPVPVSVLAMDYVNDAKAEAERMERERSETMRIAEGLRKAQERERKRALTQSRLLYGKNIAGEPLPIEGLNEESGVVVISGRVINMESRVLKGDKRLLVSFGVYDSTGSILAKAFLDNTDEYVQKSKLLKPNEGVLLRGECRYDSFSEQVCLMLSDIMLAPVESRKDQEEDKRVELHLHTQMSSYDGVASAKSMIERAAQWGHPAIAITDHGVLQAFPEAFDTVASLRKNDSPIKLIPGMEGYLVDDANSVVHWPIDRPLSSPIVVLDVETTGLSPRGDRLTEIAAVRIEDGKVLDEFSTFVNPQKPIPKEVVELTGITDDMVADAPLPEIAIRQLLDFIGEDPLAAHNASFDMAFLTVAARRAGLTFPKTCIDTLALSRALLTDITTHKLNLVCKRLGIQLIKHHRAIYDTRATAQALGRLLNMAGEGGCNTLQDLHTAYAMNIAASTESRHVTLLAQDADGLFNLYQLTSLSHMRHNYRKPRIPRSVLAEHRKGLLIGSACAGGELVQAILNLTPEEELLRIADFYDYLEIQPIGNSAFLLRGGDVADEEALRDINRTIVRLGEMLGKPVVATSDAHFIDPPDSIFREILMHNRHFDDARVPSPLYMRTTREMLDEFSYLGEETARRVVIEAPQAIADSVIEHRMFPKHPRNEETFQPTLPGAEDDVRQSSRETAIALYDDPLPDIVEKRLEKELHSIIGNGFATLYKSAQLLVSKSVSDGYLVGSRGSVGSSFVARLMGITEVNPLPPHYLCKACKHSDFTVDVHAYPCGVDLPDSICPICGGEMNGDGYDIPFEVFLGFEGDKVPDIDLNFSGEYQPVAHAFVEELFGEGNVFRAGTIGTLAERKAFGEVSNYLEKTGRTVSALEKERLAMGITGVKVTTGQHPGGMVIVPNEYDIHHFSPIQHPADKSESGVTTHFDFTSLHDILVKLDILGHDDPTMLHMLNRLTGVDPLNIPLNDPVLLSLFSSPEALGVTPEQIGSNTGTLGIPEFGTRFVRGMLEETQPTTISELLRISGLSHGTNVWLNNAQDMIKSGIATLSQCFCTRDDIMTTLIDYDLEPKNAFTIMEAVRKGRKLTAAMEADMRAVGVAEHYIDSCNKIEYMFPRSHAAAYVVMGLRVAHFKVYHPLAYYTAYFTVRADEFDAAIMLDSPDELRATIKRLDDEPEGTKKNERLITLLEIALEMRMRGFDFLPLDLYESSADEFLITQGKIRPPLNRLSGVGDAAAEAIIEARKGQPFLSVEDLQKRSRVSRAVIDTLRAQGCLRDLPETSQVSLFGFLE